MSDPLTMSLPSREGHPAPAASACAGCTGRRDFLRASLTAAGAMAAWPLLGSLSEVEALEPRIGQLLRYPIPAADGASIDSANQVILCRTAGEVMAFALSCPHQNTALKVLSKNAGFQCGRHKSKYTMNGTFLSGRVTRNMDRMPITRSGETVEVNPETAFESDRDPAKWNAAVVRL